MRFASLVLAAALVAPLPALAESRIPAGGAFMSSYGYNTGSALQRSPSPAFTGPRFGVPDVSTTATVPFAPPSPRGRLPRR